MKNLKKHENISWIVFAVISIAGFLFFRFFNIYRRIGFDWDQETLSYQLKKIITEHDIILIGHRATDAMGFYFGPYFEYLFVPFYMLSNLHPVGMIWLVVVVNLIFLALTFAVISKLFNKFIAIAFIFFWAFNPWNIWYDISVWAPLLIPIGILISWYLLWRIYQNPSLSNFILLGICVGFFTQIHSLYFFTDIFVAIFLVYFILHKKIKLRDIYLKIIVMLGVSLIFLTPLLLFDLRHDFMNAKLFIDYFSNRAQGEGRVVDSLNVLANFMQPYTFFNNVWIVSIFYIFIGGLLFYLYRLSKNFHKIFYFASLGVWILTALVYLKYSQRPSEYYFLYLYPIMIVAILDFVFRAKKIILFPIICALFLIINFGVLKDITKPNLIGLHHKDQVAQIIKENVKDQKFYLAYEMPSGFNVGYEYMLEYYGAKPSTDPNIPLVILRTPPKKGDIVVDKTGIYIPKELMNADQKFD